MRALPAHLPLTKALISVDARVTNPSTFVLKDLDIFSIDIYTDDSWPKTERPAAESLGVKFAEVNTEADFELGRGQSDWFQVQGFLSVPEREYDLVKTADVRPAASYPHTSTPHRAARDPPPQSVSDTTGCRSSTTSSRPGRRRSSPPSSDRRSPSSPPPPRAPPRRPSPPALLYVTSDVASLSPPWTRSSPAGTALRAFLPGMTDKFGGCTNIVVRAYIDLDIPVAVASLLNPLSGTTLRA